MASLEPAVSAMTVGGLPPPLPWCQLTRARKSALQHQFVHHRLSCAPRQWDAVARAIVDTRAKNLNSAGGSLYGLWRSQIGRPRDELTAITVWPPDQVLDAETALCADLETVLAVESEVMVPCLRPQTPAPPDRQGNYAFRWLELAARHWPEFQDLCAAAWPGFESAYDSQVIGLWRMEAAEPGRIRSLLLTRRPNLAMWERSKLPEGAEETEVRRKLSRRYDLCDDTIVHTATLLTATDSQDTARWT